MGAVMETRQGPLITDYINRDVVKVPFFSYMFSDSPHISKVITKRFIQYFTRFHSLDYNFSVLKDHRVTSGVQNSQDTFTKGRILSS